MMPTLPEVVRKPIKFSPRRRRRTGELSGDARFDVPQAFHHYIDENQERNQPLCSKVCRHYQVEIVCVLLPTKIHIAHLRKRRNAYAKGMAKQNLNRIVYNDFPCLQ